MEFSDIVKNYKKYVEPFIAILILIGIAYSCIMLYQNYQAKQDIAKECGWEEEGVRCWCKKSYVEMMELDALNYDDLSYNLNLSG